MKPMHAFRLAMLCCAAWAAMKMPANAGDDDRQLGAIRTAIKNRDAAMKTLRVTYSLAHKQDKEAPEATNVKVNESVKDCEWRSDGSRSYYSWTEPRREEAYAFNRMRGWSFIKTADRPTPRVQIIDKPHSPLLTNFVPAHVTGQRVFLTNLSLAGILERPTARVAGTETIDEDEFIRVDVTDVPALESLTAQRPPPLKVSAFIDLKRDYRVKRLLVVYDPDSAQFADQAKAGVLLGRAKFDVLVNKFDDVAGVDGKRTFPIPMDVTFSMMFSRMEMKVKTVDVNMELPPSQFEIVPEAGTRVEDRTEDPPREYTVEP